jgi:membrane-bound lytic murein transglycosylase B
MIGRRAALRAAMAAWLSGANGGSVLAQAAGDGSISRVADDALRFDRFVAMLRVDARGLGISEATMTRAFSGVSHDPDVAELNANQTEIVRTAGDYLALVVSDARIDTGRQMLVAHDDLLKRIEQRFGVDRHIVVAVWGIETSYGANLGERGVVRSLATLAALDQRRAAFWRTELIAALRLIERGHAPERWVGSWAGASGHTQFMPTTLTRHAVDFDATGRIDLWSRPDDALASAAAYIAASGWLAGVPPMFEVGLPQGFDLMLAAPTVGRTVAQWRALSVRIEDERARGDVSGTIALPAGHAGPAFLVTDSFRAILRYNNAIAYALSVAHLAQRIAGRGPIAKPWPAGDRALARAEREDLQRLLIARGQQIGDVDGIIGTQTRAAIRVVQRDLGLPPDGHPSGALLETLRGAAARSP